MFAFADYGRIDGVNFHTDCAAALAVSRLHVGKVALPANRMYLGRREAHPAAVPFVSAPDLKPSCALAGPNPGRPAAPSQILCGYRDRFVSIDSEGMVNPCSP